MRGLGLGPGLGLVGLGLGLGLGFLIDILNVELDRVSSSSSPF